MTRRSVLAAAAALASLPGSTLAEWPQDSYWAELAYFYPTITSTVRLDSPTTGRGTSIQLEQQLDLDERAGVPYLTLGMRLGERWRVEFEYYTLRRSADKTSDRQIEWGDVSFPVGAEISSTFNTTVYRLTADYSFYRTPNAEAGFGFGLHVTDFVGALAGRGTGPNGLGFQVERRQTLVPLPTVGLYGSYRMTDALRLHGRVDYLSLNYQDYDGKLTNWVAALEWRFARHWGAGAGYRYVEYKVEETTSEFNGQIQYKFRGPTLFVNAAF
ncbi:MAG TPA: outer membrane beta-barrel protein [Burkholderiaceae bacterium]